MSAPSVLSDSKKQIHPSFDCINLKYLKGPLLYLL